MSTGGTRARVGCSGYQYDHWRDVFYPRDIPRSRWFDHYARHFDCVEINNTFYRLPDESAFERWHDQTPPGFRYALKFSRYGTHMKKLKDPEEPIERFMSRAERLKSYLGPILVQLPPGWRPEPERLDRFLRAAPGRRWAVEVRDPRWLADEVIDVLERRGAALCLHDAIEDHPWIATTSWVYVRFHGGSGHGGSYSTSDLRRHAERLEGFLDDGLGLWVFFNNDLHGHAVRNAMELHGMLQR